MTLPDTLQHAIVERLKPLQPEKIILFGSYAYGEPHKESDIDLLVVTNGDFVPQNYQGKTKIYLHVAYALVKLEKNSDRSDCAYEKNVCAFCGVE